MCLTLLKMAKTLRSMRQKGISIKAIRASYNIRCRREIGHNRFPALLYERGCFYAVYHISASYRTRARNWCLYLGWADYRSLVGSRPYFAHGGYRSRHRQTASDGDVVSGKASDKHGTTAS